MKKFFNINSVIALTILLFSIHVKAQNSFVKLPNTASVCPTIVVNNQIIANVDFVKNNEALITAITVIKEKPNPVDHDFYNLSENVIVLVDLDKRIKTKTQSELNQFFGIPKKGQVYVNGYLIEDAEYEIASECIVEIELIIPNETNKLEDKTINVWTISKTEQTIDCKI